MKMIKKRQIGIISLIVLLTSQCANYSFAKINSDLSEVIKEVNEKNYKINAPTNSIDEYKYDFNNDKPKLTEDDAKLVKDKTQLTKKEAKKEVKFLFRLLRTEYGLYTYFGGDAKFEKQEQKILKQLNKVENITLEDYQNLLYKYLNFIQDNHFAIGNISYSPDIILFSNEKNEFVKIDDNYYNSDNQNNVIVSINGQSPENYLKRAINQNGKLTYYLYAMDKNVESLSLTINYKDNTTKNVILKPAKYVAKQQITQIYELKQFNSKIPMMELNLMVFANEDGGGGYGADNEKERNRFLNDSKNIKDNSNFIIDLRNNPGGDGSLVEDWFKIYTGEELQANYCTLRIVPNKNWISDEEEYDEFFIKDYGMVKKDGYYQQYPKEQFLENNTNLFLLTSRQTASSAEAFTDALHNLENVITIGTNTGGVLTNGANYTFELPYSKLYMTFGECFFYWEKDYFKEGYGIEPDIYLTGENLEKRLEMFFDNYVEN